MWRSLSVNVLCSVLSAVISLAAVPFVVQIIGLEAYGLVGFYAALLAMFSLLDLGLGATLSREIARNNVSGRQGSNRDLLRTLEVVYGSLAVVQVVGVLAAAGPIGSEWLSASGLPSSSVVNSVMLMGVLIGLRWPVGLYVGALQGAQRQATASLILLGGTVLGNLGALVVLGLVSPTVSAFFLWNIAVALAQLVVIHLVAWRTVGSSLRAQVHFAELRRIGQFAAGMAVTAIFGALLVNLDRLVISRIVSLEELGVYSLALLVPRSLTLFATPVFNIVYPRFSSLVAAHDTAAAIKLYRNGTRLLLAVLFPCAAFIAAFSEDLFTLWTGDAALAARMSPVATMLLLGSALNSAMYFPYAIQLAYGRSRISAIITIGLAVLFVPMLLILVRRYGIEGGAMAWALLNVGYVVTGTAATHKLVDSAYGAPWLAKDVGIPGIVTLVVFGLGYYPTQLLPISEIGHLAVGAMLAATATALTLFTIVDFRHTLSQRLALLRRLKGTYVD